MLLDTIQAMSTVNISQLQSKIRPLEDDLSYSILLYRYFKPGICMWSLGSCHHIFTHKLYVCNSPSFNNRLWLFSYSELFESLI